MDLVDRVVCVECGSVVFRKASGKGSRTLSGVCEGCKPRVFGEVHAAKDEPKGKPEVVPQGNARRG